MFVTRISLALWTLGAFQLLAIAQDVQLRQAHRGGTTTLAIRPDGKQFATAGNDHLVKLWDAASGQCTATFSGHHVPVTAVAFSPAGSLLVSADRAGRLLLWKPESSATARLLEGHPLCINGIAFAPGGGSFMTCSQDRRVKIWSSETGALIRAVGPLSAALTALAVAPDGRHCTVSGQDGLIIRIDLANGSAMPLAHDKVSIHSLSFTSDGSQLLAGGGDGVIRGWRVNDRCELPALNGHRDAIVSLHTSADGRRLLSVGESGQTVLWDAVSGKALFSHRFPAPAICGSLASDGSHALVVAGTNGFFQLTLPQRVQ